MPVGRARYVYIKPFSFIEFLTSIGKNHLVEYCQKVHLGTSIDPIVHNQLSELLRLYFVLGGMPEIIQDYISSKGFYHTAEMQHSLMRLYQDDFAKYAKKVRHEEMRRILHMAPAMLGQHIQYSKINPDSRSREIKEALDYLVRAGLIHQVYQTSASGLPLNGLINEKKFKLLMHDIGLANAMSSLSPELLMKEDLMLLNRGALAEQFVGQELLAYQPSYLASELFYWDRNKPNSTAEIDYVINVDQHIVPIEVKSGKTGRLRSLHLFMEEKNIKLGVRVSLKPLEIHNQIVSIPLYMLSELPRLVREYYE